LPLKGATFWFTFLVDKIVEEHPKAEEEPSQLQGVRLLLCERNPMTRLALSHLLIRWGIRVQEIDHLDNILPTLEKAIVENDPFWIVLFGVNQLDNLNYHYPIYPCPVAILGNNADPEDYQPLLEEGVAMYLAKPMTRKKLFEALCQLLSITQHPATPSPTLESPLLLEQPFPNAIHVLTVDDHPDNLRLIEVLVSELGANVTTASSAKLALTLTRQHTYDLILMDIQMPEMNGIEATQAIRQWEADTKVSQATPIVALTAHAMINEREALMQAGFNDYLIKPITEQTLRMMISKWTQQGININRAVSPHAGSPLTPSAIDEIKKDILQQLLATLPEEQAAIAAAFYRSAWKDMRDKVHRLHGAICYCGVPAFRDCVRKLEKIIGTQNAAHIAVQLEAFNEFCNQLLNPVVET